MSKYRVLVVEDDAAIRRGMADSLKFAGHEVLEAGDGAEGYKLATSKEYDILLLDIVLPEMTGLEILEKLQNDRPGTPVIMLTAKGSEADRVKGLGLGADDYVVKPFSVKELLARIDAILRRSPGRAVERRRLALPGGSADLDKRLVKFDDGEETPLTEREFELLRYLGTHPDRIVTREEILQRVWKLDPRAVETRTIDMTIARLRDKIRDKNCTVIQTVRGRGYQFSKS